MTTSVQEIIEALAKNKNVLLSGPPGTGKTHLVAKVVAALREGQAGGGRPALRVGSPGSSLTTAPAELGNSSFPVEIDVEWLTFHQGYSYEDFIIGKRPVPSGSGVEVKPFLGVLTSIAFEISENYQKKGCLLILDEISRAHASQVFGEFITLLDPGYRQTVDGSPNPNALAVRFPGIAYVAGKSEPILSQRRAGPVQIPIDWKFPEHVYVLATMNAVDKAAMPLDAALTRRFHRIHLSPSLVELANGLGVDYSDFERIARRTRSKEQQVDRAEHVALMLMDRLNTVIAADLGEDFELGHGLFWGIVNADEKDRWSALVYAWEHSIKPQLLDRFAGRHEALKELLYVDGQSSKHGDLFYERSALGLPPPESAAVHLADLTKVEPELARSALTYIAT